MSALPSPIRPSSSRGAALLEAIISMAVLMMGMLGMMQLQMHAMRTGARARSHVLANQYALEMAKQLPEQPLKWPWGGEIWDLKAPAPTLAPPGNFGKPVYSRLGDTFDTTDRRLANWVWPPQYGLTREEDLDGFEWDWNWGDYFRMAKYMRFWTVWDLVLAPGDVSRVKIFAINVVYRPTPRSFAEEIVTYSTRVDTSGMMTDVEARAY